MTSPLKAIFKSLLAAAILYSFSYADTFVQVNPPPPTNHTKYTQVTRISPAAPFDEALRMEMQKYPKDSAFFVDGRTGKILSVKPIPNSRSAQTTTNASPATQERASVPFQEERIEILQ